MKIKKTSKSLVRCASWLKCTYYCVEKSHQVEMLFLVAECKVNNAGTNQEMIIYIKYEDPKKSIFISPSYSAYSKGTF